MSDKDSKIKVTIDGIEMEVAPGTYLINAAKEAGIEIPTYCYHELLPSRPASCRMCLVEIEGNRKLQASCATPVMDGMVVMTKSEGVLTARASQNEFILSNHALDCPICDKGGECELQNNVVDHGPHEGKHAEFKLRFHDRDYELSPVIVKDSNRCVQCMRCTRVCEEVVGAYAIGTIGRGAHQEETSFFKTELDCDQCGMCIEVCPTGCFMRAPYRYSARPWDNDAAASVCTSCGTGCRVTIEQREGTVMRALGKLDEGFNSLLLCATGRFGYDTTNSEDRITRPMVRKNGELTEVSVEEALKVIKEKALSVSGDKVGGVISPKLSNEDHYMFKKLFKNILKSDNVGSDARWSNESVKDFIAATGIKETTSDINDCLTAHTMLVIGGNMSDENPVTEYMVRSTTHSRSMSLVIASTKSTKLDQNANLTVRNLPGTDGALLAGVEKALGGDKAEGQAKDAGVDEKKIKGIADRFKRSEIISIMVGTDLIRYGSGAKELASLVDKLKKDGKTVFVHPLLDRGNQRGAWDMGFADSKTDSIIEAASKGEIDFLYIAGEDVMNMYPDRKVAEAALDKATFIVTQDAFLTDTAKQADVVLPAATIAEREGTYTNQEGRVQKADVLLAPKGDALADHEWITHIGREVDSSFGPYYAYEIFIDIKTEIASYNELSESSFEDNTKGVFTKPAGSSEKVSGKSGLKPSTAKGDFTLITGNHLNLSGTETERSEILKGLVKEGPYAELSPTDAESVGVKDGDKIRVTGDSAEAELTVKVNGTLKGTVFIPENFSSAPVNKFFTKGEILPRVTVSKV